MDKKFNYFDFNIFNNNNPNIFYLIKIIVQYFYLIIK